MRIAQRLLQVTFKERLANLGFDSYDDYLRSDHWQEFRKRYRESHLPQSCLGCRSARYELHHHTYERLGKEILMDVMPLCRDCHEKVHRYAKENGFGVRDTPRMLREIFGWTKGELKRRLRDYNPNSMNFGPRRPKGKAASSHAVVHVRAGPTKVTVNVKIDRFDAKRAAARYAFTVLLEVFDKSKPEDPRTRVAVRELLDELKRRGE
jgi:hypothetical protein